MDDPRIWTPQELQADASEATAIFRKQRLDEPLELYSKFFQAFVPVFRDLIDRLPGFAAAELDAKAVAILVRDRDVRTAFRYLAAPPISEDDLKTLAEATLSSKALHSDPDQARRVRDTVLHIIDPHRFPWIRQHRAPEAHEREQAVVASAALVAAKKVETFRRGDSKTQEQAVTELLMGIGFAEVHRCPISLLDAAPAPGEFCRESMLGDTKADLVARLHDRRVMPIECKASNSEVNSYKRVNHEAAGKAAKWLRWFGDRATVPAAVLSGVFKPSNLETAQRAGLVIFWSHRLQDLAEYIESTK
jgi:XamI restriction endonuclease